MKSTITINGTTYSGRNLTIKNGKILIDGNEAKTEDKVINILVEGDVDHLDVGYAEKIAVAGNVGRIKTDSGNVDVSGDVTGAITTEVGNVRCGNVGGNVKTEVGGVNCENVTGKVRTEVGNIKYKK